MAMFLDQPDDAEYWRRVYQIGLRVENWISAATDLENALATIKPGLIAFWKETPGEKETPIAPRLHSVYLLLAGYILENLLKALILRNNGSELSLQTEALPKPLKNHDLVKLCKVANIGLTDEGRHLLMRITEYAIWAGRYPVPLRRQDLHLSELPDGRKSTLLLWQGTDIRAIDDLIRHLKHHLGIENKPVIDAGEKTVELELWERTVVYERVVPWGNGTLSGKFD